MQRETPEYPPHSLFLGNNVVIPSFKALPPGASKKDTALHRTRLLVAWANFCKPLGPHRGRSPFVEHATSDLSPALPAGTQATNSKSATSSRASSGSNYQRCLNRAAFKPSVAHEAAALSNVVLPRTSKRRKGLFGYDVPPKRLNCSTKTARDNSDDGSTV